MQAIKIFGGILFALCILSCNEKKQDATIISVDEFKTSILPEQISTVNIEDRGSLFGLTDCDKFLVSRKFNSSHSFAIIDKTSLQVVDSICLRGEGPEEFLDSNICYFNYKTGELLLFEPDKSQLRSININESVLSKRTAIKSCSSYGKTGKYIYKLFNSESEQGLGYVLEGDNFAFYRIDSNKQITTKELCPNKIELEERNKHRALYYTQSKQYYNLNLGKIIVSYNKLPRIDLISGITQGLSHSFQELYIGYKATADEVATKSESTNSMPGISWDISGSDTSILLGYYMDELAYNDQDRTHILAFDWEGNPIKHYQLRKPATNFCVSQDGKILYTLEANEDGSHTISSYKL